MMVRRLRRRSASTLSDQARLFLASKLSGAPKIDVSVAVLEPQDLSAFIAAWNRVQAKCKQAGLEKFSNAVRVQVQDGGRLPAKYAKDRLAVNVSKFSRNLMAAEVLAHELGRRVWTEKLSDSQRKVVKEVTFAKAFRTKLFQKPKTERWEKFAL